MTEDAAEAKILQDLPGVPPQSLQVGSVWTKTEASKNVGQDLFVALLRADAMSNVLPVSEKGYLESTANNGSTLVVKCNSKNPKCPFNFIGRYRDVSKTTAEITTYNSTHRDDCQPRTRGVKVRAESFYVDIFPITTSNL